MNGLTGIVDVGGGLRGIYSAGILDWCMQHKIFFDLGIGVSAGSANLASYIAGQPQRNLKFYTEYSMRKEYMGFSNFLRKKSFIDLDYVYGTLSNSNGEYPLDYQSLLNSLMELIVVATEAESGKEKYFTKKDLSQDSYHIFKASCAIPFVCSPYLIQGVPYYDGALADPVPIEKAFEAGCEKVVLILTLPETTVRKPDRDNKLAARIRKKYPLAAEQLSNRSAKYNAGVDLARSYQDKGKILIIAPDDTCGVGTLSREKSALFKLYEKGHHDAEKIRKFLFE